MPTPDQTRGAEYWITFDVLETEAAELEEATGVGYDERVAGVITQDPSDGTAMVAFQVRAEGHDAAVEGAQEAFDALRSAAKLGPAHRLAVTVTRIRDAAITAPPASGQGSAPPPTISIVPLPHERLLSKARTLLADGEFDYAIVAAQTACEIAIARAMRRLVAAQAAHLQTNIEALLVGRYSLSDKRVSSLWDSLAVDSIRSEAFWEPYVEHRARRNAIVHQGTTYALAEAKSSIQVAEGLCLHVTKGAP